MIKKIFLPLIVSLLFLVFSLPVMSNTNRNIKVGIIPETESVSISTSSQGEIVQLSGANDQITEISPLKLFRITNRNGTIEISSEERKISTEGPLLIRNISRNNRYVPLVYSGNWYRGQMEILPLGKNKLTVVNVLPLEEYLYGVVPSEMPASWPVEALKTQAIAARTFALSNIGRYRKEGFDVMATTDSQVYRGATAETPITNKAVEQTRGKVITYNNKLITAYYSSGAGGITESGLDAWGRDIPYLKPVKDYDYDSPKYLWFTTLSNDEIQNLLQKEFRVDIGRISELRTLERTASGRVKNLRIIGENGMFDADARKFRTAAKLNSTLFDVSSQDLGMSDDGNFPTLFQLTGRGWGHGSGLSQWGARQLAKDGKTAEKILTHYYQGTEVVDYSLVISRR